MSGNSKIEWTDHTFNGWIGCTKVSPGCVNCYAADMDQRRFSKTLPGGSHWGKGAPRHRTSEANWRQPLKWNRDAAASGARPRVFCSSLADWLDDEVPIEWLADLLALIHATPALDWELLTKRPENWRDRLGKVVCDIYWPTAPRSELLDWLSDWINGQPPHNVWIGTTVEDQTRADQRIPELLNIPAKVRFLSCEPLLGPVELSPWLKGWTGKRSGLPSPLSDALESLPDIPRIDWAICGGESGSKARPMHPDWARGLRDQCAAAGVRFFFKQWGEFAPRIVNPPVMTERGMEFPDKEIMTRFGKKNTGRLLDGVEHSAFPEGGAA